MVLNKLILDRRKLRVTIWNRRVKIIHHTGSHCGRPCVMQKPLVIVSLTDQGP